MAAMPATLAELEVRVGALEAKQADYQAVLAAVNALVENQREHAERLGQPDRGTLREVVDTDVEERVVTD